MLMNLLTKVFGSKNERELKKMQPAVVRINELESEIKALDDAAFGLDPCQIWVDGGAAVHRSDGAGRFDLTGIGVDLDFNKIGDKTGRTVHLTVAGHTNRSPPAF